MNDGISAIWTQPFPDGAREKLRDILHRVSLNGKPLQVFFRADDIAMVDKLFRRMMQLFLVHEIPLCLAVVPDWLDAQNWKAMQEFLPSSPLWCWHQHGRAHRNHESQGKKSEFGELRPAEAIRTDLIAGRENLIRHMGDLFYPVFTPPWNRCGTATLTLLRKLGYTAISRSTGARPAAGKIIPDLAVNVDLHTRKESGYEEGWKTLWEEFLEASASGRVGIMLHHPRMNDAAFVFLDMLLAELRACRNVSCCTFRELLPHG